MAAPSTTEIIRMPILDIEPAWEEHLDLIRRTVAQGATPDELRLFLYTARKAGLDPLAKQIYYIRRKGRGTVQVSIDGLRLIADRTGRYAGGDAPEFLGTTDDGNPLIARVTVYKMVGGVRCPFSASARWEEYYPGEDQGFTWRKMPHTMLAKCAEALALRRAFPADLSGLYVHEEMAQAGVTPVAVEPETVPAPIPATEPTPAPEPEIAPDPQPQPETTPEVEPETPHREHGPGADPETPIPGRPGTEERPLPYQPSPGPSINPGGPVAPMGDPAPMSPQGVATKASGLKLEEKQAFGYKPERWPSARMMTEAASENQFRMLKKKAEDRHLTERETTKVRDAVSAAYGLQEDASKGALSLIIDFLISAGPAALDAARGVRKAA